MRHYRRIIFCVLILFCCRQKSLFAQASYEWFKGWWMYYDIKPDAMRGQPVESELEIRTVAGNQYSGIQKIWCSNDTLSRITRECGGLFTDGDISFLPGKETYRREPQEAYIWNAYTEYSVEKTFFSISQQKLVLHIVTKGVQDGFVKEFAYYRDLSAIPFSLRMMLMKRYGTPQITGDADTVKVVTPLEPDRDDTMSYTYAVPNTSDLPPEIVTRKNTLVKTLDVTSPDIQVILLDDAEVDGDIISLYHNNELVLNHKTIGKELVKYTIKADAEHSHHEFALVAENLGSIPPNTALVRIRAGEMKYEFVVHSDMQENVKFIINYIGDKKVDITAPKK